MNVRPAQTKDEPRIRACAEAAYHKYIAAIGKTPAPMTADFLSQIALGQVHVATGDGDDLLGFIVFSARPGGMLLENVAVAPSAAGCGVGRTLITFCEAEANRIGAARVYLYTNEKMVENLALYEHLGYRETGRGHEDGFDRVFFEKTLSARPAT